MSREEIVAKIRGLLEEYLKNQGLDLVDLIYRYEGRDLVLRILADKPEGGISLDECARLNMEFSRILDGTDILNTRYILEVASPGLDRSLKTAGDFRRCINRRVRFFLSEPVQGKIEHAGLIQEVSEDAVTVAAEDGIIVIPLARINKGKQILDS